MLSGNFPQPLNFQDIAKMPGYYLNFQNGTIYRNNGKVDPELKELLHDHAGADSPTQRRHFVLISANMELTQREVRDTAVDQFGVNPEDLGGFVDNWD